MNTVGGYAISSWERGYGDMEFVPDWRHPAPADPPAGHGDGAVRPGLARPRARASSRRARSCRHQLDRAADEGWVALAGTELEFIVFDDTYEDAHELRLPRPDARQPVQRRLLDPRHHPRRAAAARHPQPHVRRGDGRRGRQGRVQLRAARDRLPLRRRADDRRQPRVYKTAAKEIAAPARQGHHLHGEVRRARGQLVPHPPVAARHRTATSSSGTATSARRSTTTSSPACSRPWRDFTLLYAPNINSYKRFAAGLVRADRRSPGASTTAPARSGWSATAPAPGWRTGCPGGDVNPYLALAAMLAGGLHGIENELAARGGARRQRLRRPTSPQVPATLREARDLFAGSADRPRGLRRRGRRPLHQHGRRRAGGLRRRRHRLGALPQLRKDVTMSGTPHRHQPGHRPCRSPRCPRPRLEETDAAIERAHDASPAGGRVAPGERARLLRSFADGRRRARRGAGPPRGPQRRPHHRQRPLGGRQRPRLPELLLRGPGAAVRPADPGRRRRRRHLPRAARRRRRSSCRGTSRCRSRAGGSPPRWPRATPSCSSRPSSPR